MESNNKKNFMKGVVVGALVMAFSGLLIVGVSAGIFVIGSKVIDDQARIETAGGSDIEDGTYLNFSEISMKMTQIQNIINEYYLFDKDVEKVEDGIYTGLMYGLDDPYSVYYNEADYQSLQEDTTGIYCGIGAMVSQDRLTGITTVTKVFKGAPSFEAGMLPGDIIYKVGDTFTAGIELDVLVSEHIRGKEGSFVKVIVLRGDDRDEVELNIERRQVTVPTVEYQMLENNIGYLYVMQFDRVTTKQFKQAIDHLENQGMEKLIVDLRGNPGGLLDAAVEMMAYVLPEDKNDGMLIYTGDKHEKGERYFSKDGKIQCTSDYEAVVAGYPREDNHEVDIPMVVLVNGNSASAAEVFTGAMIDYDWATIVGTQTFGKGIVQNLIPLGDDTAIKLTTSHYYTPKGIDLHGKGLAPDVEIDLEEELKKKAIVELEEDNQVQKALEVLADMK